VHDFPAPNNGPYTTPPSQMRGGSGMQARLAPPDTPTQDAAVPRAITLPSPVGRVRSRPGHRLRELRAPLLIACTYYPAARLGMLFQFPHTEVAPVWPASGLAVASLLVLGRRHWPALAVGSLHVPPRKTDRLEVTAEEEKALSALARREFRKRGVPAALVAKTEGTDLISIDLNHDGQRDLIGSFEAADKEHEYRDHQQVLDEHRLFLIAMGDGAGGYRIDYVWYFDLKAGTNEGSTETMRPIDTLDLDEDGTDEIIASTSYYESNDYQILKRGHNGKWTIVYRGGGSGC